MTTPAPRVTGDLITDLDEGLIESASATFSPDRTYRYALTRTWSTGQPPAVFIMLNPSTADAFIQDPTIRRCVGFARLWGCGGLLVCNLFALRSTDPNGLYTHTDPVGADNNAVIADRLTSTDPSSPIIAAWGAHGVYLDRDREVTALIQDSNRPLLCLGETKAGQPRHPLYVPGARAATTYRLVTP